MVKERFNIVVLDDDTVCLECCDMAIEDMLGKVQKDVSVKLLSKVDELLDILKDDPYYPSLLITDIELGEKFTGIDIVEWVKENRPEMPVIICSGNIGAYVDKLKKLGVKHMIQKPYFIHEIQTIIGKYIA